MPITLTQQTALITGASRGIGRGIALKLAEQGVKRIAINYKENDAAAAETARLLKDHGAETLVIKADIGMVADIQRMFETIKSQFGGLDIFVSNARATLATGFYAEAMEIPLEAWQATFDTHRVPGCSPRRPWSKEVLALTFSSATIGTLRNGYDVLDAVRQTNPRCLRIILTGYPDLESALKGIQHGVDDYITKPNNIGSLAGVCDLHQRSVTSRLLWSDTRQRLETTSRQPRRPKLRSAFR